MRSMKAEPRDSAARAAAAVLAAAIGGDQEAFRNLAEPYTRELHLHCYRLLGSFHDAEDAVQETLIRAWRHLATFEERSSLRAWLYRIATNVCLTQRRRRPDEQPPVPNVLAEALARSTEPAVNLSPYPDALLDEIEATSGDPAAEYDLRESVQLAFLAVVQLLPPRQRAVLILRDVVGFSAAEVAQILDSTTASVNSAHHRARVTLDQQRAAGRLQSGRVVPAEAVEHAIVRRYIEAWQAMDTDKLVGLLRNDVVMTMPPLPLRLSGREEVRPFLASRPADTRPDEFRVLPTRANRQPAVVTYRFDPDNDTYRPVNICVLTLDGDAIAEITAFRDPTLVSILGLPAELPRAQFGGPSVSI